MSEYPWNEKKNTFTWLSYFTVPLKRWTEDCNHEIKYQENYKHLLIFLKRNEIWRVTFSHFVAFSKWAKVEGYIDLRITIKLLFKNLLRSQTHTEILQYLQRHSNFLTVGKSEGYSPFIELFWGLNILDMLCKNWVPSINEK